MAERKRIALIFEVNKNWMGGTYYILNLIKALNTLPDNVKPEILLLCSSKKDFDYAARYTKFPYLCERQIFSPQKTDFIKKIINKAYQLITGHYCIPYRTFKEEVDVIYPVMTPWQIKSKNKKIYWIPDFQELFMPELFSAKEIKNRKNRILNIIRSKGHIIFSSQDALDTFNKYYPQGADLKKYVLHFASKIEGTTLNDNNFINDILCRYNISNPFFYCPNQFWAHKNHLCLFKAIKILKNNGIEIQIVCSGATDDYRNKQYFSYLKTYIQENDLINNIKITGLVSRNEQLVFLNNASAVIQPSLFEGWNTSVEEAKSMSKFIILSDLKVHKEQVDSNVFFFERNNPDSLAKAITDFIINKPIAKKINYFPYIEKVGKTFYDIIKNGDKS